MELPVADNLPNKRVPTQALVGISEDTPTPQLIAWALDRFAGQRMVVTTAFGMEGCVLIDMIARHNRPFTVLYMDTMFFFAETYALRDRLIERYPKLSFVNVGTDLTPEAQAERFGPELWKRDPDLCCRLRKVEPMRKAMENVDVWVTSIRRSQSLSRQATKILEWEWRYGVLKFCPLADWSRAQVWQYVRQHDVPYNPLHEQGYPSIGCTHCTKSVEGAGVTDYSRDGRWRGTEKTECGLHGDGI